MSDAYNIQTTCLRYIIPFRFEESFEEALNKVDSQKEIKKGKERFLWSRREVTLNGPESDLFSYIKNEFRFDDNVPLNQKVGCEWLFWRSKDASNGPSGHAIKELLFFSEGIGIKKTEESGEVKLSDSMQIIIPNIGLLLFRNGLGFFWYEIKFPKDKIDSSELMMFQYLVKELARGDASLLWEKSYQEPDYGLVIDEEKGHKKYISPFLFGEWIYESLSFLNISFFAERKNSYYRLLKNSMNALKKIPNEIIQKKELSNPDEFRHDKLPDKAILFTYASFDPKDTCDDTLDRYALTFHLANGYRDSFHFSDELIPQIRRPFDDVYWYATQEGVAYLAWSSSDNREVRNTVILSKMKVDYFTLYIKALYQSYSLLSYAEKIQTEISAVNENYLSEPLDKKITELFEEINLFLTKSMATSVSHIHHQSEFYIYLKKQLRIAEDVKSVTSGLNSLDALQREQRYRDETQRNRDEWRAEQERDREIQKENAAREERERIRDGKLQAIMGLFALLGISSALVDCFDFISKFDTHGEFTTLSNNIKGIEYLFFAVIGFVSVLAICFSFKAIWEAFKNNTNDEDEDKN